MKLEGLQRIYGDEPLSICRTLFANGEDAVILIRDVLRGEIPNDHDLATSARPERVQAIFPKTIPIGIEHGTVGVQTRPGGKYHDTTTFRFDKQTDGRHAVVQFTDKLEEDLLRRDFTMNAIALRPHPTEDSGEIVDPYGGVEDLKNKVLRAVGDPSARFAEDWLRVLRGYRFIARFGLTFDPATHEAARQAAPGLKNISAERVRDELLKMFMQCNEPGSLARGLKQMQEDGVMAVILPELDRCAGVTQNHFHAYDVYTHIAEATDAAGHVELPGDAARGERLAEDPKKRALFRMATLMHDIGKPATRWESDKGGVHFYRNEELGIEDHEVVGAQIANPLLERLKFSRQDREWVVEMVRHHMALKDITPAMRPARVQRALREIKKQLGHGVTLYDLLRFRVADKRGSGVAESELSGEHTAWLEAQIDKIIEEKQATSREELAINGNDLRELGMKPGPEMGRVLDELLVQVIREPQLNQKEILLRRAAALAETEGVEEGKVRRQKLLRADEGAESQQEPGPQIRRSGPSA